MLSFLYAFQTLALEASLWVGLVFRLVPYHLCETHFYQISLAPPQVGAPVG